VAVQRALLEPLCQVARLRRLTPIRIDRKGRILFRPQTLYCSDGAVVINLVLYRAQGHREPWYLATSLTDPRQVVRMYLKRMQPEQHFRDGKQRFGLNQSTVTTTDRLQRLLVGLPLACCLLIRRTTSSPSRATKPDTREASASLDRLTPLNVPCIDNYRTYQNIKDDIPSNGGVACH